MKNLKLSLRKETVEVLNSAKLMGGNGTIIISQEGVSVCYCIISEEERCPLTVSRIVACETDDCVGIHQTEWRTCGCIEI